MWAEITIMQLVKAGKKPEGKKQIPPTQRKNIR